MGEPQPFMFGPPPTPEQKAHMAKVEEYELELLRLSWQLSIAWAPVTCSCRRWFEIDGTPPQSGCPLHSNIAVTNSGEVIHCASYPEMRSR
jgi:hypothetical protein